MTTKGLHQGFLVEVNGRQIGQYSEVSGLQVQVETHSYSEGGVNDFVHQLPGRMTWPNIILKRGLTNDDNLLTWFNEVSGTTFAQKGALERASCEITLVDAEGRRTRSWVLNDAFPIRWTGPTIAIVSDNPTEELEVAHHGFTARVFA